MTQGTGRGEQGTGPRLNCVDMSRWGGELTEQEARELWDLGVRHVVVGCGDPNGAGLWARQQGEMWLRTNGGRGGTLDAYIYLYMAGSASEQVSSALRTLAGVPVRMWWIDAEDVGSPELTPARREAFIRACRVALGRVRTGIYTGRWWWVPNMADSSAFADLELWNSWYDGDPDTDGLPYGGWVESAIEQYQGTTVLAGQSVDLNYAKNLEEPMGMTSAELSRVDRLEAQVKLSLELVAGNGVFDAAGRILTGEAAVAYASAGERRYSAMASGQLANQRVNQLAFVVSNMAAGADTTEVIRALELLVAALKGEGK